MAANIQPSSHDGKGPKHQRKYGVWSRRFVGSSWNQGEDDGLLDLESLNVCSGEGARDFWDPKRWVYKAVGRTEVRQIRTSSMDGL